MKKVLFTGGGSAGHVVPNLALIEELLAFGDVDVCYMGTDGIEKKLVAEQKIPYFEISCPKFVRGMSLTNLKRNLKIPLEFFRAKKQAIQGLKACQPDLVFSKGGYVALPVIAAAKKLKIPCLAHESDFSAGLANKLSANACKYVFTSFPETAEKLPHGKYSGAPLRRSLFSTSRQEARKHFGIDEKEKVLLVFGGGSGSAAINEAIRKNIKALTKSYTVLHVCGKGNVIDSRVRGYHQFEFIKDMGMAYACADLVIARAGSGTVFELLALKKPAILIPLEGQTRGDQIENAKYFEKRGLCYLLKQTELEDLVKTVEQAFQDESLRANLKKSNFERGNENILREIRKILQ